MSLKSELNARKFKEKTRSGELNLIFLGTYRADKISVAASLFYFWFGFFSCGIFKIRIGRDGGCAIVEAMRSRDNKNDTRYENSGRCASGCGGNH
ncbi:hypothetical protein [Cupriavidus pinatubonensis]|uniref:hypothetical protein n=1 Tax=Cupriavidus pinatubonensis TaxID=248026 RepID=UPI001CC4D801|nr:hypothetical protein [Cupriavidus pinatubonensis]